MVSITHRELKMSMLMERLNTHHHTSPRNTEKYTPEVREGRMIPVRQQTHTQQMGKTYNRCRGNIITSVQLILYLPDPGEKSPPLFLLCSWLQKAVVLVQLQTLSASGQTGVGQTGLASWSPLSCQRTILPCRFPPQTQFQRFRLPDRPEEQPGRYDCPFLL